jgi:hypothetical protein
VANPIIINGRIISGVGPGPGAILRKLHIPWPAADESSLYEAAKAWTSLAETIRDNYGKANVAASSLVSNNAGEAINAFDDYWNSNFSGKNSLLLNLADSCDKMAQACNHYADDVVQTKHKIEVAGEEITAALVFGTIGAIFTFFATEAAAAAVVSYLTDEVATICVWLAAQAGAAVDLYLDGLGALAGSDAVQSVLAAGLTNAFTGAAGAAYADSAVNIVDQLAGQQQLSPAQVSNDILIGGAEGSLLAGGLGSLGELSGDQLSRLLNNASVEVFPTDPDTGIKLAGLAQIVAGSPGKVSAGVLASVASQLYVAQQISAEGVVSDRLQDILTDAIQGKIDGGSG